jgi:hypothetical protein
MTAERIDYLLDPKAKCIEIGAFVGEGTLTMADVPLEVL